MVLSILDRENNENAKIIGVALSTYSVLSMNLSATMFEDGVDGKSLGDFLFGRKYVKYVNEDSGYLHNYRFAENLMREDGTGSFVMFKGKVAFEIIDKSLIYIPQPKGVMPFVHEYDFEDYLYEYLDIGEENSDVTVINTSYKPMASTKYILARAKKIIVIIKPDYTSISRFLDEYKSIRAKCVFVVLRSHVDKDELKRIRCCFNLSKNDLIYVKKTVLFEEAALNGKVIDYIREFYSTNRKSSEYNTMFAIKQLAKYIYSGEYEYISGVTRKYSSLMRK